MEIALDLPARGATDFLRRLADVYGQCIQPPATARHWQLQFLEGPRALDVARQRGPLVIHLRVNAEPALGVIAGTRFEGIVAREIGAELARLGDHVPFCGVLDHPRV